MAGFRSAARACAVVVLAIAVLVPVSSGIAAETRTSAVPAKLVGVWSRNVTNAEWKKYGVTAGVEPVGVWRLRFSNDGVHLYFPGTRPCDPQQPSCEYAAWLTLSVTGSRLTLGPVLECVKTEGVYGWKVSRRALTLKPISDKACGAREAVFTGVWKRK